MNTEVVSVCDLTDLRPIAGTVSIEDSFSIRERSLLGMAFGLVNGLDKEQLCL